MNTSAPSPAVSTAAVKTSAPSSSPVFSPADVKTSAPFSSPDVSKVATSADITSSALIVAKGSGDGERKLSTLSASAHEWNPQGGKVDDTTRISSSPSSPSSSSSPLPAPPLTPPITPSLRSTFTSPSLSSVVQLNPLETVFNRVSAAIIASESAAFRNIEHELQSARKAATAELARLSEESKKSDDENKLAIALLESKLTEANNYISSQQRTIFALQCFAQHSTIDSVIIENGNLILQMQSTGVRISTIIGPVPDVYKHCSGQVPPAFREELLLYALKNR